MDPAILKKLIISSVTLWLPAVFLLAKVWMQAPQDVQGNTRRRASWWIATIVGVGYLAWLLNGFFQVFDFYMLIWPLLAGFSSLLGFVLALFRRENRFELAVANVLLMVLGIASIVAPN